MSTHPIHTDSDVALLRPERHRGLGLRWTILVTLTLLIVGTVFLVALVVLHINHTNLEAQKIREARSLASLTAKTVLDGTAADAQLTASSTRGRAREVTQLDAEILGLDEVSVLDRTGTLIASSVEGTFTAPPTDRIRSAHQTGQTTHWIERSTKGRNIVVLAPIGNPGGESKGLIVLRMALQSVDSQISASQNLLLLYMAIDGLLVLLMGYFVLTRLIVKPIIEIGRGTRRVASGNYTKPVQGVGIGELGHLAQDFNAMLRQLRDNREALEGQVIRLQAANDELAAAQATIIRSEKLATVGRLGAGMAHEIGNPLAAVLGYIELMRERSLDDDASDDLLRRTQSELQRIDGIIRDLLDYARTDRGETVGPVSIRAVVDSSIQLVAPQPRARHLDIVVGTIIAPRALAVESQLRQVLVNLLLNAADAGADTVTIHTRAVDTNVEIIVEDSGPGFADEALPHLFEPFYTTKGSGDGTGLGLAICHSIIVGFGGEIRSENIPAGGARFTVALPSTT